MTNVLKRNNVQVFGQGTKTILFAHGFGCDQNMWRFIIPAFKEHYKVVVFDYVGCGQSDLDAYDEQKYSSLNGYADDIIDVCHALDLKDVVFVGHSVSSMIGVIAYSRAPELFESLIMVCPSPRYINDDGYTGGFDRQELEELLDVMGKDYMGWASFFAPIVMKNADKPELANEIERSFCAIEPRIARKFAEVTFFSDNRNDLEKVKAPTLILQCSDDAIAPEEVGYYVHENIQGSTLVKMKAIGHCPHMSHPNETIEKITEFLLK